MSPQSTELADFIAYLEQRRDNAEAMAGTRMEFAESARERARQIEVVIDDLKAGMHLGAAEVRAALLAKRAEAVAEIEAKAAAAGAAREISA